MKKSKVKTDAFSQMGQLHPTIPQINILKAFAIITVVFLHTFLEGFLLRLGSPYYLWHAIPIFIVIAGFTGAYAYKRYGSTTLKQCYDPLLIIGRFKRLLIPFFLCWIIEIIIVYNISTDRLDLFSFIPNFLTGGFGYGAYFIPVILQSVLIVPLLYLLALRNPERMVIIALILTLVFDAIVFLFGGDIQTSLIYFRYLFAGALGVWVVTSEKRNNIWLIIGGIISVIYITLCCYTPIFSVFPEYNGYGGIQQAPAFVWTVILVLFGLAYLPGNAGSGYYQYLGEIGKASWHIFLVQMLYFLAPAAYIYAFLLNPLSAGNVILHFGLGAICNITICVSLGYGWYYVERKILQKS